MNDLQEKRRAVLRIILGNTQMFAAVVGRTVRSDAVLLRRSRGNCLEFCSTTYAHAVNANVVESSENACRSTSRHLAPAAVE